MGLFCHFEALKLSPFIVIEWKSAIKSKFAQINSYRVRKDTKNIHFLGGELWLRDAKPSTLKSFISSHVSLCALLRLFSDLSQIDVLWSRPLWTPSKNKFSLLQTNSFCFITARFIIREEKERQIHTLKKAKMLGHTSSLSYDQVSFHWLPFFKLGQREYWVYILLFTQGHMLFYECVWLCVLLWLRHIDPGGCIAITV